MTDETVSHAIERGNRFLVRQSAFRTSDPWFNCCLQGDNRPISLAMRSRLAVRSYILFQLDFLQEEELRSRLRSWRVNVDGEAPLR